MRFYNIYFVCKAALSDLRKVTIVKQSDGTYRLDNWETCKNALQTLLIFDFISNDVNTVYECLSPIDREKEVPCIGNSTQSNFKSTLNNLCTKLHTVVDLYESMRDGESSSGVDIKIPHCKDFDEYISILKDINFILYQCPYLLRKDEELRYNGTDIGSEWITFVLTTSGIATGAGCAFYILNNLAALINKAIALRSNANVFKMQDEMIKSMQNKNEVMSETIDVFNKMKELTLKNYVDELKEEIGELNDYEEEDKVAKTLEKLVDVIDKGVEIYTSIETPKEIKVLFPFSEKQDELPDNLMKYLEAKSEEDKKE